MKRKTFNIVLCIVWALLTVAYIVLGALGVEISAYDMAWPCCFIAITFFEEIFREGE